MSYKNDFSIFKNSDTVYLDSAATTQKPDCVIEAEVNFYRKSNANPYRGTYALSVKATEELSSARQKVAEFLGASDPSEIIFTKNATESLNLLAFSYALDNLCEGDEVVISIMEHHSNLVPWQKVCAAKKAVLKYMYIDKNFELSHQEIDKKITKNTKIVSVCSVSNVLGTKNDIPYIAKKAHEVGAVMIVDASQSVAHIKLDTKKMGADFVVFSAHKMYGALGVGVLWGRKALLEKMSPFIMGGDMIEYVYEQSTTFAPLPHKFEAGTQNVAGAVALGQAVDYIDSIGYEKIFSHDQNLTSYALNCLKKLDFVEVFAPKDPVGVISFNIKGIHAHDAASLLDMKKIAVRAGNHCAQPLLRYLNIPATCRCSFGIYNDEQDVDKLVLAIEEIYAKWTNLQKRTK